MKSLVFVFCLNSFLFVQCIYPPIGDEVQPGSVLLPASRRGRYLANIVRRQAVDGTGIKFNKDADRMNAEAKKKVDVLSEELLPYIIAEQERRTTLYKRVMTAIQNGEKGVTIAEIRNKPPLIIRKGLMFRCPMNRAPKEPDGTGIIMCEDDIEPSPIMFDSCLSAEDRDLYVAENKYFFCNRHKVEGPDLPRNGSTVIGCAPMERTSLNYTSTKCALEDSDDVVVHYRYYPDRTYKFVTELDPDREVCEHWNPCQIGYIYSLPSPDQALPANELWRDYVERQEEVQNDEYIPPIPEDSIYEFVSPTMAGNDYTPIPRRLKPPPGYTFDGVWRIKDPYSSKNNKNRRRQGGNGASAGGSANGGADASGGAHANSGGGNGGPDMRHKLPDSMVEIENNTDGFVTITLHFKFNMGRIGAYYAVFIKVVNGQTMEKSLDLVTIEKATVQINEVKELQITAGQHADPIVLPFKCGKCELLRIMVRADDFNVYNLETTRYKVTDVDGQKEIQIELDTVRPKDVGYFVAVFRGEDAVEEYMQIAKVDSPKQDYENILKISRMMTSATPGEHVDKTFKYDCAECDVTDIFCNGESVLSAGRVSVVKASSLFSFSFPSFEDNNACVYLVVYKKESKSYRQVLAVIENASPAVIAKLPAPIESPAIGAQSEIEIPLSCEDCTVEKVFVNGVMLDSAPTRRTGTNPVAYFMASPTAITIRISEFSANYEGIYQAQFDVKGEQVTKTIMEIKNPNDKSSSSDEGDATTAAATEAGGDATTAAGDATAAAEGETTAADGEATTAEGGGEETEAPPEGRKKG